MSSAEVTIPTTCISCCNFWGYHLHEQVTEISPIHLRMDVCPSSWWENWGLQEFSDLQNQACHSLGFVISLFNVGRMPHGGLEQFKNISYKLSKCLSFKWMNLCQKLQFIFPPLSPSTDFLMTDFRGSCPPNCSSGEAGKQLSLTCRKMWEKQRLGTWNGLGSFTPKRSCKNATKAFAFIYLFFAICF